MVTSVPPSAAMWTGLDTPTATRPTTGAPDKVGETNGPEFSGLFSDAVQAVEDRQTAADKAVYSVGSGEHDYAGMMIALEEANISLRAMGSVRDKFVEAYQAIWNMPV